MFKGQVKELPYMIPCHGIHFLTDLEGVITYGRKYFGNTRETFCATVLGRDFYIMTSATNIAAALKSLDAFDFSNHITDIMRKFGISPEAIEILHDVPTLLQTKPARGKSLADIGETSLRQQLNPGPKYNALEAVFLGEIDARLTWDALSPKAIQSHNADSTVKTVSLLELVRHTLVQSTTVAFFGPAILQVDSTIVDTFLYFDDRIWMFLYGIPPPWSSSMRAAKMKLHNAIHAYLALPKDRRPGAAWLISTLEEKMSGRDVSTRDIAGWLTMIFWVLSTNTWRLCFWVSAHILHDPILLSDIRSEVLPHASSYPSLTALNKNLSSCKLLESVYHETLRLVDSPISIRKTTKPVVTALGESLPAHAFLMLVHREILMEEEVWGHDVRSFNPKRFLRGTAGEAMLRSKNYTPFGGGPMLCPGRFMVKSEVMVFVALLISRFDMVNCYTPQGEFPRLDTKNGYEAGIMVPMQGDDIVVNLGKREVKGK
ncbi:hypothetical protein CDD82_4448 [Ophiocordyceps australis]|uniref:Cytochrome P450 n=1 Tax=Ophiocordyceps australis TaxID=1399860 RepID=A0A2C5XKF6_9HYPO|nr:hypothetical protein CDD82_4448 [Ophiocordyceps australis]